MTTRKWIEYHGEKYDIQPATQEASIRDLKELLRVGGISVAKIAATFKGMKDMQSNLDVYEDPERLDLFAALLFLCLRKAGRRDFTWDDAQDTPMVDIVLVFELDDAEGDADPKASDPRTLDEPEGSESGDSLT